MSLGRRVARCPMASMRASQQTLEVLRHRTCPASMPPLCTPFDCLPRPRSAGPGRRTSRRIAALVRGRRTRRPLVGLRLYQSPSARIDVVRRRSWSCETCSRRQPPDPDTARRRRGARNASRPGSPSRRPRRWPHSAGPPSVAGGRGVSIEINLASSCQVEASCADSVA